MQDIKTMAELITQNVGVESVDKIWEDDLEKKEICDKK